MVVYGRYCWESPLRHRVRAHSPREKFSLCLPHMLGCHPQDTFQVKCFVKCFSFLAYIMNSDSTSQCSVLCQNYVPPSSKVEPKRGTESHFLVALWNTSSALVQIFPECALSQEWWTWAFTNISSPPISTFSLITYGGVEANLNYQGLSHLSALFIIY